MRSREIYVSAAEAWLYLAAAFGLGAFVVWSIHEMSRLVP